MKTRQGRQKSAASLFPDVLMDRSDGPVGGFPDGGVRVIQGIGQGGQGGLGGRAEAHQCQGHNLAHFASRIRQTIGEGRHDVRGIQLELTQHLGAVNSADGVGVRGVRKQQRDDQNGVGFHLADVMKAVLLNTIQLTAEGVGKGRCAEGADVGEGVEGTIDHHNLLFQIEATFQLRNGRCRERAKGPERCDGGMRPRLTLPVQPGKCVAQPVRTRGGDAVKHVGNLHLPSRCLVVEPGKEERQTIGTDDANCLSGRHSFRRKWNVAEWPMVNDDPLAQRPTVVGGLFVAIKDSQKPGDERDEAREGEQQAFAFPGFHRRSVARRQMDSTAESRSSGRSSTSRRQGVSQERS